MARADYTQYSSSLKSQSYNSGCSQFFIMTKANTQLKWYIIQHLVKLQKD